MERLSKKQQKVKENNFCEKHWVVVAGKGLPAQSFQQNLQNKPVGRKETQLVLQFFLSNNVKYFSALTL